ncbi:MAG TPA: DUF2071 domain-containing protein [Candidatus Polarisedimenticolaceae bacterium]|nr:DUF2071 domain-containing protein [Candidatus Polarisedimenticolaceae bacterium]
MQNDFDYGVLEQLDHRPWPLPDSPWVMTQTWHDLLFAHWPIEPTILVSKLPRGLELDLYDGGAWLGVVPFRMTNVAPRAVPALPWVSAFAELNVRTYVRIGDRPGVYFFSLDAANSLAVAVARTLFHLPYHVASMDVTEQGERIRYRSRRESATTGTAEFGASYGPLGPAFHPDPGSLEHFLTERYCLYAVDGSEGLRRVEIHHPRWRLQSAVATFETNAMAETNGITLPNAAPRLHFARRQDVVAWLPTHQLQTDAFFAHSLSR